jgi:amino acid permease
MNILTTILLFVLMLAVILGANVLCRKFIFSRIRINKWIPLAIAAVLLIIQMLIRGANIYVTSVLSVLTVLFFLWYMDIMQTGGLKKKGKQITIKPKAKPNRVKKNK